MTVTSTFGGQGSQILRVVWSLLAVSTALLIIRLYVRLRLVRDGGSWSLIWAFIAWALGIAGAGVATNQVLNEIVVAGKIKNVSQMELQMWIFFSIQSLSFPIARFSVLAFLFDLQGPTHHVHRRVLVAICGLGFAFAIVNIFLIFFQCQPPSHLWQRGVHRCPTAIHNALAGIFLLTGGWGAVSDLCLALYPIYLFSRLNIRRRIKILVMGLMGLGVFSATASVVLTYALTQLLKASQDNTFRDIGLVYQWMATELWVVLIAGSLPAMWPLIQRSYDKIETPADSVKPWKWRLSGPKPSETSSRRSDQVTAQAEGHPFQRLESRSGSREPVADAIQVRKDISVQKTQRDEIDEELGLELFEDIPKPPPRVYL